MGDPDVLLASLTARFWKRVDKRGPDDCWPWVGSVDGGGYGTIFNRLGKPHAPEKTHRVSWEIANGRSVPSGVHVCHKCDNPPCCNPSHLFLGTATENALDREQKGRGGDRRLFGSRNGSAVLTSESAIAIIAAINAGESQTSVAKRFGVDRKTVFNIIHGRVWGHVTGVKNGVV